MDKRVALKKKMRVGDKMEFSNGTSYELLNPPIDKVELGGDVVAEVEKRFSKNWFSVLFKIPPEIIFKFIKGDRNENKSAT